MVLIAVCYGGIAQRQIIDFNDEWYFKLGNGYWMSQPFRNGKGWQQVDIPHDWSIEHPFDSTIFKGANLGYLPGGQGWYLKRFSLPESDKGKRIIIEFDGVYMNSTVYVNGVWLGKRPFGYIGFDYDLTPYLNYGEEDNVVTVFVDNSDHPNSRWYSGSGIYRKVRIIKTDKVFFPQNGVFVYTEDVNAKKAQVKWLAEVKNETNSPQELTIEALVLDADSKPLQTAEATISLAPGEMKEANLSTALKNPLLWSPANPYLYRTKVTLKNGDQILDTFISNLGIRSTEFTVDKGFLLNGEQVKLKGVCLHHDGGAVGAAVPEAVWERRLRLLKEMGANAVRTSHNPFAPEFYRLCDEMGLMVMDEVFDEWTIPTLWDIDRGYNLYWEEWHERDLRDFIRRDRNHPSVVIWSVGNEIIESDRPWGKDMANELVDICHELDPTRAVTCGINMPMQANKTGFFEVFDVAGYNYAPSKDMYPGDKEKYPNRKFIGTENTQGLSTRGVYHIQDDLRNMNRKHPSKHISAYAQDYRRLGHEGMWRTTDQLDYVAGCFIWTGIDYLGESVIGWPSRSADFGTIDLAGFPKDDYYWFQSQWTDEPMLHLLPHWNWNGMEGKTIPVHAYTNADKVELFLNGKSLGKKAFESDSAKYYFLEWKVAYQPGTLRAIGYSNGKKVAEKIVNTTTDPSKLVVQVDKKELSANGDDVAHVTINFEDRDGNHIPTANKMVTLKVEGAGKLIGVDNGDPTLLQSFQSNSIPTFNGLALALIQADKSSGTVTVTASSEGLADVEVVIQVE